MGVSLQCLALYNYNDILFVNVLNSYSRHSYTQVVLTPLTSETLFHADVW